MAKRSRQVKQNKEKMGRPDPAPEKPVEKVTAKCSAYDDDGPVGRHHIEEQLEKMRDDLYDFMSAPFGGTWTWKETGEAAVLVALILSPFLMAAGSLGARPW